MRTALLMALLLAACGGNRRGDDDDTAGDGDADSDADGDDCGGLVQQAGAEMGCLDGESLDTIWSTCVDACLYGEATTCGAVEVTTCTPRCEGLLVGCLNPHQPTVEECGQKFRAAWTALGCTSPEPVLSLADDLCADACLQGTAQCGQDAEPVGCSPECQSLVASGCDWNAQ